MKEKKIGKRLLSLALTICLLAGCVLPTSVTASKWNMKYFLGTYQDWHFDLKQKPAEIMTVEEFIALVYAYSYYGGGSAKAPSADKNGVRPSAWCAKYVQAEVDKGTVIPGEISYKAPATLAFAAEFLSRSKGKYAYDFNNTYSFRGTGSLSTEAKMFLNVAVDHSLIAYTPGMNVATGIPRGRVESYLIAEGAARCKAAKAPVTVGMKELNAYFVDCYWDMDAAQAQLQALKASAADITMVTFASAYLSSKEATGGNLWLCDDMCHEKALKHSDYRTDPQIEAVNYCKQTGKLALLGISNAGAGGFETAKVAQMLSSAENQEACIGEIMNSVNTYRLDGVNLGFEHIAATDRANFSAFVKRLSAALHQNGNVLLSTVGAYHSDKQQKASCYDYQAISAASDYVHVILYDDFPDTSYPRTGKTGAMSNLVRIGRVMRYAATAMEPEKLLIGLSSFAIDYNTSKKTAEDIPYSRASALLAQSGNALQAEPATAGAYFRYSDTTGSHLVSLESPGGIAARAKLAYQYALCGVSFYFVGSGYTDALEAVSSLSSYKPEIMEAMQAQLIPLSLRSGYQKPIKRAEFCKLISAFLEQYSGKSMDEYLTEKNVRADAAAFSDTTDPDVLKAAALGIVSGVGGGKFSPESTITRQEAAAMLMRLAKTVGMTPNAAEVSFTELPAMPAWAQEGVRFVSACQDPTNEKRVMGGTGNNKFSPKATYTREQSVMTMIRLFHGAK